MTESLNETFFSLRQDQTYRRQGKHIIIASMESITPLHTTLDPNIWGGGTSDYTWGRVQKFFARSPLSRKGQMPMHFFSEYLSEDYVTYVGCPISNKSWFLQLAVATGVLPVMYNDAILVVLQENYAVENVERRLWELLSHTVLTPLMRDYGVRKEQVLFYEQLASTTAVDGPDWPFRYRKPTYLDPLQLQLYLKEYEKR